MDPDVRKMWGDALRHLSIGLEIIISLGIGYALGWWLDTRLGTTPYLRIVGLLFGIGAAVKALLRTIKEYRQEIGPDAPFDANAPPLPPRRRPRRRRHTPRPPGGGDAGEE